MRLTPFPPRACQDQVENTKRNYLAAEMMRHKRCLVGKYKKMTLGSGTTEGGE